MLPIMMEAQARAAGLFIVPTYAKADAEAKFANLARRAMKRLKVAPPVLAFVAQGEYRHSWEVDHGDRKETRSRMVPALFASITGDAPKIAGWTLAGRIQTLATGERLIGSVPGIELPTRFRDGGTECEHCNTKRFRRDVFAVCDDAGKFIQVGKTCLRDFLGHDPAALLKLYTAAQNLREEFSGELGGLYCASVYGVDEVLAQTAACVRVAGFISRAKANEGYGQSTADLVLALLSGRATGRDAARCEVTPRDEATGREALAWVRNVLARKDGASDYEHNLIVSLKHDVVDHRSMGIVASAYPAYLRELSYAAEKAARAKSAAASEHIGAVKERLRDVPVTVEFVKQFSSDFGPSTLIKMRTDAGAILSWFATGDRISAKPGDHIKITGTVKEHAIYQGAKETRLTRCAIASAAVAA